MVSFLTEQDLCHCDFPIAKMKDDLVGCDIVICENCKKIIPCKFCTNYVYANVIHLDYIVCKKHEKDAISNIADRLIWEENAYKIKD